MTVQEDVSQLKEDMATVKTQTKAILDTLAEMKKGMVWKDTCEERHKGVDASISVVKRKTCRNEKDLEEHKKEDTKATQFWIGTGIAIVALILSSIIGFVTFAGG